MVQHSISEKVVTSKPADSADTAAHPNSLALGSMPGAFDLNVSLARIPSDVSDALERLAKPAPTSGIRAFFKDYLPALVPLAAVAVSFFVGYYGYRFNERTSEISQRAAVNTTTDALGKILDEFGSENTVTTDVQKEAEKRKQLIAAMKLAAYGDQALPAVKIVIGGGDQKLRSGAVQVAEQMYRAGTVEHSRLTSELVGYYDNPAMQLGVLEWLVRMKDDLSLEDERTAFQKLQQSFGPNATNCASKDDEVTVDVATAISNWQLPESKDLLLGIATNCTYIGARNQAIIGLDKIIPKLNKSERDNIKTQLGSISSNVSPPTKALIDDCIRLIDLQANQ